MSEPGTPNSSLDELKALGVSAKNNKDLYSFDHPDKSLLEKIALTRQEIILSSRNGLRVVIEAEEFTSRCPMTGQPDFGKITIEYEPKDYLVESKSLKLYLMGYRQHQAFHEKCIQQICTDIHECIDPNFISVTGNFTVRGGISINPHFYITR